MTGNWRGVQRATRARPAQPHARVSTSLASIPVDEVRARLGRLPHRKYFRTETFALRTFRRTRAPHRQPFGQVPSTRRSSALALHGCRAAAVHAGDGGEVTQTLPFISLLFGASVRWSECRRTRSDCSRRTRRSSSFRRSSWHLEGVRQALPARRFRPRLHAPALETGTPIVPVP